MDLKIVCLTKEMLCLFLNGGGGGIRNLQSRKYVKTLIGKSSSHSKVQGRDSKGNEQQQSQQGAGYGQQDSKGERQRATAVAARSRV